MQKKLQRREKQRTKDVAHKTHNTWRSVIRGQNITHNAMGNGARCPVQHTKDKVDSTLRVYLRPQNAIFQKTCTIVKVGFGEPDYIRIGNKSNCCFFSGQVGLACGTGVLVPSFFGSSTGPRQVLYHQLNTLLEFAELLQEQILLRSDWDKSTLITNIAIYRMVVFPLVAELLPYTSVQSLT